MASTRCRQPFFRRTSSKKWLLWMEIKAHGHCCLTHPLSPSQNPTCWISTPRKIWPKLRNYCNFIRSIDVKIALLRRILQCPAGLPGLPGFYIYATLRTRSKSASAGRLHHPAPGLSAPNGQHCFSPNHLRPNLLRTIADTPPVAL